MKTKHYFLAGLGALMLGACSNDSEPATPDNGTSQGKGFISLKLKYAGNEGRTVGFEEGTADESEVKTVKVHYFEQDGGKYLGAGVPESFTSEDTPDDENIENKITASVPATVIGSLKGGKKVDIIVVLNETDKLAKHSFSDYATFNAALSSEKDNAGFMMTSVNYWNEEKENYFVSIGEANVGEIGENPTPVEVYVERVCGKVVLTKADQVNVTQEGATCDILGWGLNVRNKTVFPVKKLKGDFTSYKDNNAWPGWDDWTSTEIAAKKRAYWAVDPNYDGKDYQVNQPTAEDYPFKLIKYTELTNEVGEDNPLYCLENTFNYAQQDRDESTTAVVFAQYIPKFNDPEFSQGTDKTWVIHNNLNYTLKTFLNNAVLNCNFYIQDATKDKKYNKVEYDNDNVQFTYTPIEQDNNPIGGRDYKLKLKEGVKFYKLNEGADPENAEESELTEVSEEEINKEFETYCKGVKFYINGYCYYDVPIRHFTDDEVPLAPNEDDYNTQTQLGRYGVVRNHYYKLNITSVHKPGKPLTGDDIVIPEGGTDDPKKDVYMTVDVKVLSWAVRTQNVEL